STTSYDKITLGSGNIALNAGTTFNLAFAAGFTPTEKLTFDLMTGTLTGDFAQYAVKGLEGDQWNGYTYSWIYADKTLSLLISKMSARVVDLTTVTTTDWTSTLLDTTPWNDGDTASISARTEGTTIDIKGGTRTASSLTLTVGSLTITGEGLVIAGKTPVLSTAAGSTLTLANKSLLGTGIALTNAGTLNLNVDATLSLSSMTNTGVLNIGNGTKNADVTYTSQLTKDAVFNATGTINIASGSSLAVTGTNGQTITMNGLAGTGTLEYTSGGTSTNNKLIIGGDATKGLTLKLNTGVLTLGLTNEDFSAKVGEICLNGVELYMGGNNRTVNNKMSITTNSKINTWGGSFTFSGNFTQTVGTTLNIIQSYLSNKITFSGENVQFSNLIVDPELLINTSGSFVANDLKFANGRVTLMTVSGTGNTNINGVLSQGGFAGSLVKSNTGTLTLAGVNTYAGGTTINGGKIVVNSKTSGLGTGAVTLSGNDAAANATLELATGSTLTNALTVTAAKFGTLSGAGTYGALTINGNLSMGADKSVMTLNATSLTTGATSTLNFDVASTTSYDKITLGSGNIALNAGTTFNLAFAAGFTPTEKLTFDLMTGTLTGDFAQYAVKGLEGDQWNGYTYSWIYADKTLSLLISKMSARVVDLTTVTTTDWTSTLLDTTPWNDGDTASISARTEGTTIDIKGGTRTASSLTLTVGSLTITGEGLVIAGKTPVLSTAAGSTLTLANKSLLGTGIALTNAGTLNLNVDATLSLSSMTNTGVLNIGNGTKNADVTYTSQLTKDAVFNATGTINIASGSSLAVTGTNGQTITMNGLAGTGTLEYTSGGTSTNNKLIIGGDATKGLTLKLNTGVLTLGLTNEDFSAKVGEICLNGVELYMGGNNRTVNNKMSITTNSKINTWGGSFTFSGNFTQTVGTTLNIIQSYLSNKITFSGENVQFSNLIVDPELLINTSGSFVANDLKFANGRVTLMTVSGTGNTNINGVLSQGGFAGSLVKSNTGTLTLAGVNTYAGGTTINGGKIVVNSKTSGLGTGAVTLSGNDAAANATLELATGSTLTNALTVTAAKFGTLSGAGTYGALTINGNLSMGSDKSVMTLNATSLTTGAASTLNFDVASTTSYDKITLGSGNIALNAGTTFNLAFAAGFASDTEFNLDLMTGTLTGDLAQYAVTGLDTSVWGYTWVYANSKLTLQLINKNPSLTWVGGADARWTLDTTTPWTNGTTATAYKNTTKVVFNDLSGKNAETVTIKGEVAPQSILVSNATTDYTLASDATTAGVIAGAGALTKEGAGSLTILTNNTSTGVMTISAGEVTLGNGTISGAWAGNIVNNSILNLNNTGTTTFGQLLSGSGKMVIKSGTVVLNNKDNSFSGGIDIQGAGTILKYTTGWENNPSSFFGTGTITMGTGTRMELSPNASGGIVTHKNALVLNGGTIVAMNRNHVFDNTVSLTGSNTLLGTVAGRNMSLTGVISGDGSLYVGSSDAAYVNTRIILTGANTYTG
ncbi:MAG: autotransporter-associated beta strand repeat-containing protein, partial [Akkermansia sp.]